MTQWKPNKGDVSGVPRSRIVSSYLRLRLWCRSLPSSEKQIVGVASGSWRINQSQCSFSGILIGLFFRWHSGESIRLSPMGPRFDSRNRRHVTALLGVFFSEYFGFHHPKPLTFQNSSSTWDERTPSNEVQESSLVFRRWQITLTFFFFFLSGGS